MLPASSPSPITRRQMLAGGCLALCGAIVLGRTHMATAEATFPVTKTAAAWQAQLTPAQYNVLRAHGTEPPHSSPLNDEKRQGTYHCAACAQALFAAATKFNSGTGWPSFWRPLPNAIGTTTDFKLLAPRTEVHCANCGGHLGHVFADGPQPTGLRYCMNGVALAFKPES
jgi:peptide-methionine (R)-S-oxide reductase